MSHTTTARALALAASLSGCSSVVVGASSDASVDRGPTSDTIIVDAVTGECTPGLIRCGAICVDPAINPFHCGACRARCNSTSECTDGRCVERCDAPLVRCGGACTDVATSQANCGACGAPCAADTTCRGGVCLRSPVVQYASIVDSHADASWVEACSAAGHRNVLVSVDDSALTVPSEFAFPFWGSTLPEGAPIVVCSNGWIGLDGLVNSSLNGVIPQPTQPNALVAAHWTDIVTRESGVCVATVGAAPSRRMVFEWSDVTYFGDGATRITFEIALVEDGTIELLYRTLSGMRSAEVGIEDPSGYWGASLCRDAGPACPRASNTRVRLVPSR